MSTDDWDGSAAAAERGPVDVLRYQSDDDPVYRAVPAGEGETVVAAHEREYRKRRQVRLVAGAVVVLVALGYGVLAEQILLGVLAAAAVVSAFRYGGDDAGEMIPTVVERNQFRREVEGEYDLEGA